MATTRLYRGADGVYRPTPLDQDRNPVAAPSLVAASNVAIDWSPAD